MNATADRRNADLLALLLQVEGGSTLTMAEAAAELGHAQPALTATRPVRLTSSPEGLDTPGCGRVPAER